MHSAVIIYAQNTVDKISVVGAKLSPRNIYTVLKKYMPKKIRKNCSKVSKMVYSDD